VQNNLIAAAIDKGWLDVLINTNDGWVILDHKFTNKKNYKFDLEAIRYSGQLLAYKEAVEATMEGEVKKTGIHLPFTGEILSISS
jgi:ATP-dependent exoDNAse (exonuclease V) beta subunit